MDTGEVWAYREHPRALGEPVHRVEIVKVGHRDGMIRVRRLDGEDAGFQEWAHPSSLLCRWDEADRRLGDEQRMLAVREASAVAQGTAEYEAAVFVVGHCGLGRRVALGRSKAELGVMRISKATVVGNELGLDVGGLAREHPAAFTDSHGVLVAPWPMAMTVARQAASAYAGVILPELEREERESRSQALYRWENPGYLRARGTGREQPKPDRTRVHEMVREWCGAEPDLTGTVDGVGGEPCRAARVLAVTASTETGPPTSPLG